MPATSWIPLVALALFIFFALAVAFHKKGLGLQAWMLPAVVSVLFAIFSVAAILDGGPVGFWPVHTADMWGNQVWIDLLIGIGIGWAFVVPQAKDLGMRVLPWLGLILLTGCIGLLAMVSRVYYLRDHQPALATA